MNPLSYAKAGIAGIAAPIADWLLDLLAAWAATQGLPMPEPVQAALVGLLVGLVVWWVPNLPPGLEFELPKVKPPAVAIALILAAGLALPACAAKGYYAQFDAIEKGVIEPEVDAALDRVAARFCKLPADVMLRAMERHGPRFTAAIVGMCPEWQRIGMHLASAAFGGSLAPGAYRNAGL